MDNSLDTIAITRLLLIFDSLFFVDTILLERCLVIFARQLGLLKGFVQVFDANWRYVRVWFSVALLSYILGNVLLCGAICLHVIFIFLFSVAISHSSLTPFAIELHIHVHRVAHSSLLVEGFFGPSPLLDPLARGAEDMHICTISAFILHLGSSQSCHPYIR